MTAALRYGVGSLLCYVQAAVVRKNSSGGGTCGKEELVNWVRGYLLDESSQRPRHYNDVRLVLLHKSPEPDSWDDYRYLMLGSFTEKLSESALRSKLETVSAASGARSALGKTEYAELPRDSGVLHLDFLVFLQIA